MAGTTRNESPTTFECPKRLTGSHVYKAHGSKHKAQRSKRRRPNFHAAAKHIAAGDLPVRGALCQKIWKQRTHKRHPYTHKGEMTTTPDAPPTGGSAFVSYRHVGLRLLPRPLALHGLLRRPLLRACVVVDPRGPELSGVFEVPGSA